MEARNEAFRRLGRNLYFFQLIEHQLKHLIVHSAMDGHPEELQTKQAKKAKRVRKASMGNLAEQFTSTVFRGEDDGRVEPSDPSKPWFAFSFRIESDERFVQERKKEMRRLVRERNKLIHTAAADIRPDDTDKWIRLGVFLDEQRAELVSEHEKLRLLINNLAKMAKQSVQAIEFELLTAERNSPGSGD